MKKLTILTLIMLSMGLVLTGCNEKNDMDDETINIQEEVLSELEVDGDMDDMDEIVDRDEYSFEVSIKGADGFDMISKIYKKWDKSLTEIIKMFGDEGDDMPFNINKMLKVGGQTYQQVEKGGEIFWFSIPGMNAEDDMFNLKEMSTVVDDMVVDTKKETINWEKLTCYYIDDEIEGKGKTCLDGEVFAYGEYSEDGVMDVIEIKDFDDSVKDKVFATPNEDEILSTQDMMQLFQ